MKFKHDSRLAELAAMTVIVGGLYLIFNRHYTVFWWCFALNFSIGYISMSAYAVYLRFEGKLHSHKNLVQYFITAAFAASFWAAIGLQAYADYKRLERLKIYADR